MNTDVRGKETTESLNALTRRIVGAAMEVSNELGCGFLEKVYEKALTRELRYAGLTVADQVSLPVHYKGEVIATYVADLVVEGRVVIEPKCVDAIRREHLAQCLNYLKATGMRVSLLFNFQRPRLEWKRIVR